MFRSLIAGAAARLHALPSSCAVCAAWPARTLCEQCVRRFAAPTARCRRCALPVTGPTDTCGQCVRAAPPIDACLAAVPYAYPWADCIAQFKFHGRPGLARALGLLMRSMPWAEPAIDAADLIVPMPLSGQRLRSRGFNQAALLAAQLSRSKTANGVLLRLHDLPPQRTLDRAARMASAQGAFALDPLRHSAVRGKRVVVVDDVMTTGATLYAAATALQQAGAAHVTGMVIARTE